MHSFLHMFLHLHGLLCIPQWSVVVRGPNHNAYPWGCTPGLHFGLYWPGSPWPYMAVCGIELTCGHLNICVAAFLWKIEKMRKFACIVAVVRDMGITSTKLALYVKVMCCYSPSHINKKNLSTTKVMYICLWFWMISLIILKYVTNRYFGFESSYLTCIILFNINFPILYGL